MLVMHLCMSRIEQICDLELYLVTTELDFKFVFPLSSSFCCAKTRATCGSRGGTSGNVENNVHDNTIYGVYVSKMLCESSRLNPIFAPS